MTDVQPQDESVQDEAVEVETQLETTADEQQDDGWADQMADGEDYDESMGEPADDERVLATDELDEIDDDDAPEGSESRAEEWEGDDPADIPDEHGGTQAGVDTDDNGIDDTVLPEGTDSIIDAGDWE